VSRAADNTQRAPAPAGSPVSGSGGQGSRAWQRLRGWLIPLGGAAIALLYGILAAGLRPGAALLMLTMGGLTLALCAMTLYRMLDPLLRPASAGARAERATESTRLRELEREKQLVLKAIREIEHDFQMRKISEADHKELTQRYRTRALRLISQIDAGDDFKTLIEQELKTRLGALEAARSACPSCGTPNETDADFCKKCGKKLGKTLSAGPAETTS
jgi:hypothetical protein